MADFGEKATTLSPPQAAGANPLAPVAPAGGIEGILNVGSSLLDVLGNALKKDAKASAEQRKNNIVGNYVNAETTINEAVATGQMTPAQAAARSRANFNQYASGYAEYIEDFEKAGKALRGFTEKGEVENQLKTESEMKQKNIDFARSRGYVITPNMGEAAINDAVNAAMTGKRAEDMLQAYYAQQTERRSQANFDVQVEERRAKDMSLRVINDIASANIQSFQSLALDLRKQVESGTATSQQAEFQLATAFSNIDAALTAASNQFPDQASSYRSIFQGLMSASKDLMDPKKSSQEAVARYNEWMAKSKLAAVADKDVAAHVVTSELFGPSAQLILQASPIVSDLIARISQTTDYATPQVVGAKEEGDVLKILKHQISNLDSKMITKPEKAQLEAETSVNNILTQVGDLLTKKGANAKNLKTLAEFFGSPEYAKFVTKGATLEDNQAAKKTFDLLYTPTITQGVEAKLNGYLYEQASFSRNAKREEPKVVGEVVDVTFNGMGIQFSPKKIEGLDPVQQQSQQANVRELQYASAGINQLIRIGAHMEGRTDYKQFWEENKHTLLPNMFAEPSKLKVGDTIDGPGGKKYKFIKDGDPNDKRNWEELPAATAKP